MMTTTGLLTTTAMMVAMVVGHVTCDCPKATTALTFNTGLTTTVDGYDQRRTPVVENLKVQGNDVDFMCLQEMWFEKDVKQVLDELGVAFPYHYSAIHSSVGVLRTELERPWYHIWKPAGWDTTPCDLVPLATLMGCIGLYCSKAENQRMCAVESCSNSFFSIPQQCRSCVSAASSGLNDVLAKCWNTINKYNRINQPGLLVLSKKPLTGVQYVNYHEGYPVLLERGYIKAKVQGSNTTFVCTHLSAVFPYYFEVKLTKFSSFLEEQRAEILKLNNTFHNTPHVLLGDFNSGPQRNEAGLPTLTGEATSDYSLLTGALHYQNPYLQNKGNCTYCPDDNPVLRAKDVDYNDSAIDYVLTSRGVMADIASAKRVLDDYDVMLSDHFGVKVDICQP